LDSVFKIRAATALVVSVAADALDYVAAPLFAIPVIGDVPDALVTSMLYAITRSKRSALLNMVEFVPVVGDFVPTYTISTLLWIYGESKKKKKQILTKQS
jgi:predicted membrane protein